QQVYVGEPSVDGTIAILRGLKEKYEVHHGVKILDSAILAAAKLSHRYIADRFLPDKAIDLVDEAASKLRIEIDSMPLEIDEIERKIIQYRVEMQALKRDDTDEARGKLAEMEPQLSEIQAESDRLKAIWQNEKDAIQHMQDIKAKIELAKAQEKEEERKGNYEKVSEIRFKTIPELENASTEAHAAMESNNGQKRMLKEEVDDEDISEIVAKWTGIPVTKLLSTETEKLLHIEEKLHERVIGQNEAVDSVANAIRRSRSGLADPDKPIGVFLFMGPTGVGKTELAKSLADYLFDSEKNMVRVDMSEYMEKHSVSRMVGAPPGYVGHEEGGQLTEAVRRRPYSVVLLDEVEKAHPDVFNILLQVFDDGRLTDSQGRTVDFKNTVIIMTSNVKDLKATFRPEFLNRIDDIVDFKPLSKDMLSEIVTIQLNELAARLKERHIALDVTDVAKAHLAEIGFDADFGARPLRRTITRLLENPLAMLLLEKRVSDGGSVKVDVVDGEIVLNASV
ncbi:MAG: AAA family ATPase, partial [bacterium]|nr:AAA family ATPase [bacterium]